MLNGFVLEINNENGFDCEVPLFLDFKLPTGVIIKTSSAEFSYDDLIKMAQREKFIGSGFQSDIIQKVVLVSPKDKKTLKTPSFSMKQEIILDGLESYLHITIPEKSFGMFQLIPYLG